MEYCSSGVL
jgi:hypothetical protein